MAYVGKKNLKINVQEFLLYALFILRVKTIKYRTYNLKVLKNFLANDLCLNFSQ